MGKGAIWDPKDERRFPIGGLEVNKVKWGAFKEQWGMLHNHILVVLFLGRVVRKRMSDPSTGDPFSSARVNFRFLRDIDEDKARSLIYKRCSPIRSKHLPRDWVLSTSHANQTPRRPRLRAALRPSDRMVL